MSIIGGFWKWATNQNERMAKKRYDICLKCDRIQSLPIVDISGIDIMGVLKPPHICGICKCILRAKTRDESEECPHPDGSKWPKIKGANPITS
jgi:uncharacterized CHY-type Zn-finger protein